MMQITVIDELEAAEFRVASEFRVFVYAGAANDVTVYGISGCPVEQALETAAMLSRENELIWSVAVRASELQWSWISGMDYRKRPENLSEWRRRKQMQDRYLSAKVKSDEPPVLPSGLKRVRMFPEWGVELPLWGDAPDPHPYDTGGMPLANQLEHDLVEWNREWMSYGEVEERPDSWKNRGRQLFDRLESALRGSVEVLPMFDDGESSDGAGDGRSE